MFGKKSSSKVSDDHSDFQEIGEQIEGKLEELLMEIEKGGQEFTLCYALAYCTDSEKDFDEQLGVFIEVLKGELGESSELKELFKPVFVELSNRVPREELKRVASIEDIHTSSKNITIRRYMIDRLGTVAVTIGPKILKFQ